MNNLPKVVTQQRRGRASNPRLLDRKSDALPLSHRATLREGRGKEEGRGGKGMGERRREGRGGKGTAPGAPIDQNSGDATDCLCCTMNQLLFSIYSKA